MNLPARDKKNLIISFLSRFFRKKFLLSSGALFYSKYQEDWLLVVDETYHKFLDIDLGLAESDLTVE